MLLQRCCSKFRSVAALRSSIQSSFAKPQPTQIRPTHFFHSSSSSSSSSLSKTLITPSFISPNFRPLLFPPNHPPSLPQSLMQVRHLTLKQRKRKLKCRQPPSPVVSKLKKYKIKAYSSFKGRFRTMNDGQIRRWKEGKRHNAHQKSKIAKRRGRLPALVPAAYAKVMKKLNFCG